MVFFMTGVDSLRSFSIGMSVTARPKIAWILLRTSSSITLAIAPLG